MSCLSILPLWIVNSSTKLRFLFIFFPKRDHQILLKVSLGNMVIFVFLSMLILIYQYSIFTTQSLCFYQKSLRSKFTLKLQLKVNLKFIDQDTGYLSRRSFLFWTTYTLSKNTTLNWMLICLVTLFFYFLNDEALGITHLSVWK